MCTYKTLEAGKHIHHQRQLNTHMEEDTKQLHGMRLTGLLCMFYCERYICTWGEPFHSPDLYTNLTSLNLS